MQPRSPPAAPEEAQQQQGTMMEPARRKRRRPAPKPSGSGSETEDHATSDAHGDDESCDQAVAATTTATAPPPTRGPFRGKCLYQSRKCENERALKRNGKPHNLCDEHRDKQNQHQRKFDAKKYTRGKRSASEDECHDSDSKDHGKRRASVPADKPKRSKVSPATTTAAPPLLPTEISAAYAAANQGHSDPYYLPSSDVRPLEIRRPPALDVLRSSPVASGYALPPLGQHDHRSPQFGGLDLQAATISVPPGTPVDGARAFPSPHGATAVYPFLRPPPQSRSRSFDSGVTRISPMGGAAPGSMGPHAFQLGTTRSPKLPSLQQLPLGQLTRSTSSHLSPYTHQSSYSPYDRPSQQQPHFSFPRPPPSTAGPLLPSLRQPIHLSRSSSLSSPPPHRSYPPHRDHEQHPY